MDPATKQKLDLLERFSKERNAALNRVADTAIGLSAASLSLVVAFHGSFTGTQGRGFLKAALLGFGVSLTAGLFARLTDVVVYQKLIQRLRDDRDLTHAPGCWASVCFAGNLLGFVFATACLVAYGFLNL